VPLYEYQCKKCGNRLEKIQRFNAAPLTECPKCGGLLERVLTAPAVQFKGGGWHSDLYSSSKSVKKSDSKSEGSSDKSASGAKSEGGAKSSGHTCGGGCKH
jgi:putative FmdB family regulatory protein